MKKPIAVEATLFGISQIQGLVQTFKDCDDFIESPSGIIPWTTGHFSAEQKIGFSFVVGWWDKKHIGDHPIFNEDGGITVSEQFMKLTKYINPGSGNYLFFQLAAVDAYASGELINLGPYDIDPKWDFSTGSLLTQRGRCPVRQNDVMTFIRKTIKNVFASCMCCKILFPNTKLYYVFPPPPVESEEYILNAAKAAEHYHKTYAERYDLLLKYGVRPFSVRYKLITFANDMLKLELNKFGINFVDPPAECLLPSGAINVNYAKDMHHGNDLYNRSMMNKISDIISIN